MNNIICPVQCFPGSRFGYTTGACATAAAIAAALTVTGATVPDIITVLLPGGASAQLPLTECKLIPGGARASVRKVAGDDPDITHGAIVNTRVSRTGAPGVRFFAGPGVGRVTLPGLQISPGEPAINPVPRRMIADHLLALAPDWSAEVSIDNGERLAQKTFNPRLGIVGGLSILGTSGIVRPFSHESRLCSIRCSLGVAAAAGVGRYALVPGRMGERAARSLYRIPDERALIEVGNDWGFALDCVKELKPANLLVAGHPGKLAKLVSGSFDTHSSRSTSALSVVEKHWIETMRLRPPHAETVEGFFKQLDSFTSLFAVKLADAIADKVSQRICSCCPVAVALTDMKAGIYGESRGICVWK
jgi:cobalt-precorrin-5B (C1)-methyltransferase